MGHEYGLYMDCIWLYMGCMRTKHRQIRVTRIWTVYGLYMAVYGMYARCIGLYGSTWTVCALDIYCVPLRGLYMDCMGSIWTVCGYIRLYMSCMRCIWTVYGYICVLHAPIWTVYARGGPGGCPPRDEGGISIVRLLGARRANIR